MASSLNKQKILRDAVEESSTGSIVIGGADMSALQNKQTLLEEKIEEAKETARVESEAILNKAKTEADQLMADAQSQIERIKNEAIEEGVTQGRAEGLKQINQELEKVLEEAGNILKHIEKEREECLEDEEQRVYNIIIQVAKQLFKRDFSLNKDFSDEFIKSSINLLSHRAMVNIVVNPEAATKLNEIRDKIIEAHPGLEELHITANADLNFGDLILESNRDRLDLRLESQLEELLESMTKTTEE